MLCSESPRKEVGAHGRGFLDLKSGQDLLVVAKANDGQSVWPFNVFSISRPKKVGGLDLLLEIGLELSNAPVRRRMPEASEALSDQHAR